MAFTVIREWRAGTSQIEQLLELEDEMTDGDPTDQLPTGGDLPTDGDPTDQRPTDGHATDELPTDG